VWGARCTESEAKGVGATLGDGAVHPSPYTLHPTPFTLHPLPYTLHPAPCTLHPTPYALRPTPDTHRVKGVQRAKRRASVTHWGIPSGNTHTHTHIQTHTHTQRHTRTHTHTQGMGCRVWNVQRAKRSASVPHWGMPYTLHPTPYNLHPTPDTLHPTPYTLHPTPYTRRVQGVKRAKRRASVPHWGMPWGRV